MINIAVVCEQDNPILRFEYWVNKKIGFDKGKFVTPKIYETSNERYYMVSDVKDCRGLSLHSWLNMNQEIIPPEALVVELNIRIERTKEFEESRRKQVQGIERAKEEASRFAREYTFKWDLPAVRNNYVVNISLPDSQKESQNKKEIYKMMSFCYQKVEDSLRVMFNKPATVLFIGNEKIVSKCHNEDYNETKGFLMCFAKACKCTHSHIKSLLKHRGMEDNPNAELMFLYDFANRHGLSDAQIKAIVDKWSAESSEQMKVAAAKRQERVAKKTAKKKATATTEREKSKDKNIKEQKKED